MKYIILFITFLLTFNMAYASPKKDEEKILLKRELEKSEYIKETRKKQEKDIIYKERNKEDDKDKKEHN